MSAGLPSRSERDLTEDERRLLAYAHAELRVSASALRDAQEWVEAAEERLWQLREGLLGWARPPWAPRASLVSDWFSEEDADYDLVTDPASS
jgi:hypothetical protein